MPDAPRVDEISVLTLVNAVLRRRRMVLGLLLAFLVGAIAIRLLFPSYVAESQFTPQSPESNVSRFAGLAAQLGFRTSSATGGESPEFYAQLLKSRQLLDEAVHTRFVVPTRHGGADSLRGTLIELYRVESADSGERVRRAVDRLRRNISVATDPKSSIVTLRVSARNRGLSEAVSRRLLDLVNEFNLQKRQTQAAAERKFVEARLQDARGELENAEADMQSFLQRNRSYQGSPQLTFEATRLQRRITLRQEVYSSLAESFERARIDEVRNTPLITVVDAPEGSGRKAGNVLVTAVVALLAGACVALMLAFALEMLERARREGAEEYLELRRLALDTVRGGWLSRRRGRRGAASG
jgi:uncharacterized protein involved in exopolysaccharide biosynthesis